MQSDRDASGGTFNNTYNNGTLVGNWLEDRLQHREGPHANLSDGLLADPRITRGNNALQVRDDLMHSTYGVDYGNHTTTNINSNGTTMTNTTETEGARGAVSSVLLGRAAQTQGSNSGDATQGKGGVNRALLFSKDPVVDPAAALPLSTNTATYGAFARGSLADGTQGEETTSGLSTQRSRGPAGQNTSSGEEATERNLYDSVLNAGTRASAAHGGLERSARGGATMTTTTLMGTSGFASLSAPGRGDARSGSVGRELKNDSTGTAASTVGEPGRRRGQLTEETEDEARWCTTKQAADVPVEHFVLQRRLPPVRM